MHLSFCISCPGAWDSQGRCGCCCLSSWEAKSTHKVCGKQGRDPPSLWAGVEHGGRVAAARQSRGFFCLFDLALLTFLGVFIFVVYCTNLFLSFHYGFGLRASLRKKIGFFHSKEKKKLDVFWCSRTDHKKPARGTWRAKKGGKEKSTQLVKTSRKVL